MSADQDYEVCADWGRPVIGAPEYWRLEVADLALHSGYIGMIHPLGPKVTCEPATFVFNGYFHLQHHYLFLRHSDRSNHFPFTLQYYAVPSVPSLLRDLFQTYHSNDLWIRHNPLPPVIHKRKLQLVSCAAREDCETVVADLVHPVPTFKYLPPARPTIRIRQDAHIQLQLEDRRKLTFTASLLVQGSRGFTPDFEYEILELQCTEVSAADKNRTMFFLVPPPFVHIDVAMITVGNTPNTQIHRKLLSEWNQSEELYFESLSEDSKHQRSLMVWKLLLAYLEARRVQK